MDKRTLLAIAARILLARMDFWSFCKLLCPSFYKDNGKREYLKRLCNDLQEWWESDCKYLIINLPPQMGKSLTIRYFILWLIGKLGNAIHVMYSCYNMNLSTRTSKNVRDDILTHKTSEHTIVFRDIFPNIKLKKDSRRKDYWILEDGFDNFLATSPGGPATGFGATLQIYDDIIRDYAGAINQNEKDANWNEWYLGTMQSRLREGRQVFIMTRWATDDFSGRIIDQCQRLGIPYKHICYTLEQPNGELLCEDVISRDRYYVLKNTLPEDVFESNYNQKPVDMKNRLYTRFNFYVKEEEKENFLRDSDASDYTIKNMSFIDYKRFEAIGAFCDSADTGEDFLAMLVFGVYKEKIYILDMLYTQAAMEYTEVLAADMLDKWKVDTCKVESNNGGRGWARNVDRILRENYDNDITTIETFPQTQRKMTRILHESSNVMRYVYFPYNWNFEKTNISIIEGMKHLTRFVRIGKNDHDDIEDAISGVCEMCRESGYIMQEI